MVHYVSNLRQLSIGDAEHVDDTSFVWVHTNRFIQRVHRLLVPSRHSEFRSADACAGHEVSPSPLAPLEHEVAESDVSLSLGVCLHLPDRQRGQIEPMQPK